MRVRYLAHPVRPQDGETLDGNVEQALLWYLWALSRWPGDVVCAPWITEVQILDDSDEEERAAGLARCEAMVARCDELVLCGGRISPGMERERRAALRQGIAITDLTELGSRPPEGRG